MAQITASVEPSTRPSLVAPEPSRARSEQGFVEFLLSWLLHQQAVSLSRAKSGHQAANGVSVRGGGLAGRPATGCSSRSSSASSGRVVLTRRLAYSSCAPETPCLPSTRVGFGSTTCRPTRSISHDGLFFDERGGVRRGETVDYYGCARQRRLSGRIADRLVDGPPGVAEPPPEAPVCPSPAKRNVAAHRVGQGWRSRRAKRGHP